MLDNKFFFTIIGLFVAIFALCKTSFGSPVTENFWGNAQYKATVKKEVYPQTKNGVKQPPYSVQNNWQSNLNDSKLGNSKFFSTSNLQSNLSPRFSNLDYGSNIRYNMTDYKNQAVPCNPLSMSRMATENYTPSRQVKENYGCGGDSVASCSKGGLPLSTMQRNNPIPSSQDPAWTSSVNQVQKNNKYFIPTIDSLLPVGDMTNIGVNGEMEQAIVYDRLMFSNQRSRLRNQGDQIRGDLAIVPCTGNWFTVSVNPNIDLSQGALNVMGGYDNQSSQALAKLVNTASGKTETAIGGIDMTNQFRSISTAGCSDINVTSFA